MATNGGHEEDIIYRGELEGLVGLYEDDDPGSLSNIWPTDGSWLGTPTRTSGPRRSAAAAT
jgi:hypothetical protein